MSKRKNAIYNKLFLQLSTKQFLADEFSVSTKTIENTIKSCKDIIYSKKIGAYHFENLLPQLISYQNYFSIFKNNLSNNILKKDILSITKNLSSNLDEIMIETESLSPLSKKIIQMSIAINHNCIVKLSYEGNNKPLEEKYIQTNQIITSNTSSTYYLYATYDKKNKKSIGSMRALAFNSITHIEPIEYVKDVVFQTTSDGNEFGLYDEGEKIMLSLTSSAAHYFKREALFENKNFKFISEDSNHTVEMEMTYNHKIEVVKLLQQWMPQITIKSKSDAAKEILEDITNNYNKFIGNIYE